MKLRYDANTKQLWIGDEMRGGGVDWWAPSRDTGSIAHHILAALDATPTAPLLAEIHAVFIENVEGVVDIDPAEAQKLIDGCC